jgi:hypothetical protein
MKIQRSLLLAAAAQQALQEINADLETVRQPYTTFKRIQKGFGN